MKHRKANGFAALLCLAEPSVAYANSKDIITDFETGIELCLEYLGDRPPEEVGAPLVGESPFSWSNAESVLGILPEGAGAVRLLVGGTFHGDLLGFVTDCEIRTLVPQDTPLKLTLSSWSEAYSIRLAEAKRAVQRPASTGTGSPTLIWCEDDDLATFATIGRPAAGTDVRVSITRRSGLKPSPCNEGGPDA